ncbi:hypothetical protein GW17_00017683 [Ensete ventricosum]|nr:hypothetical protein GW17_00017683 [Ensete ventricosum]
MPACRVVGPASRRDRHLVALLVRPVDDGEQNLTVTWRNIASSGIMIHRPAEGRIVSLSDLRIYLLRVSDRSLGVVI